MLAEGGGFHCSGLQHSESENRAALFPPHVVQKHVIVSQHGFGIFSVGSAASHQQNNLFGGAFYATVYGVETVYQGLELRGEAEVVQRCGENYDVRLDNVAANLMEIIFQHTVAVHSACAAGSAGRDLMSCAVKSVHFVSCFFCSFDKLRCQVICVAVFARTSCHYGYFMACVPEIMLPPANKSAVFKNLLLSIDLQIGISGQKYIMQGKPQLMILWIELPVLLFW